MLPKGEPRGGGQGRGESRGGRGYGHGDTCDQSSGSSPNYSVGFQAPGNDSPSAPRDKSRGDFNGAKRSELMELAINGSSVLRNQRGLYATDSLGVIVSWTDLQHREFGMNSVHGSMVETFTVTTQQAWRDIQTKILPLELYYN
jgi:hypothetical protein